MKVIIKKNKVSANFFTSLVIKHANSDKQKFASLIGESYRWVLDKCSGKEGVPSEKLITILQTLGYNNFNAIDFDFDSVSENITRVYVKGVKQNQ